MKLFKGKKAPAPSAPEDKTFFLEGLFGSELSAKLVDRLGVDRAAEMAEGMVADAKHGVSQKLTDEEMKKWGIGGEGGAAGIDTIAGLGRFFQTKKAEQVAERVAVEAIATHGLPQEWRLDLGARIYLVLIPMRPR